MEELTRNPQARLASVTLAEVRMPYESMKSLLLRAFCVPPSQLSAPDWINSKHYSIEAKMPSGAATSDVPEMLKSMLSARFGLSYHTEMRTVSVAFLTLRKGGLKASPATPESKPALGVPEPGARHYELPMTTAQFAESLTERFGVPVTDNTGSDGRYMFVFDVFPRGRPGEDRAKVVGDRSAALIGSYDDALAPLGLHIESRREVLETVIIDRLSIKPTEN